MLGDRADDALVMTIDLTVATAANVYCQNYDFVMNKDA